MHTGLENRRLLVRSPACSKFFPRIDDSHCDRIQSSFNVVCCFHDGNAGNHPAACSQFVWANGRAARIGRTIPVRSIGLLLLLEALLSLPLDIWKSWQSFQNKMAEAANKTRVESFNLTFIFVVKYKSSRFYLVIRLLILRIHFGVVNIR